MTECSVRAILYITRGTPTNDTRTWESSNQSVARRGSVNEEQNG